MQSRGTTLLVNELEPDVRTVVQDPAELDVKERQRLEVAGVLQWPSVDCVKADCLGPIQHRLARRLIVTGDKGRQDLSLDLAGAHVLCEYVLKALTTCARGSAFCSSSAPLVVKPMARW